MSRRRVAIVAAAAVAVSSLLITTPVLAEGGGDADAPKPQKAAVISPTLDMFTFGAGVGGPILCAAAANVVAGTAANVKEASTALTPVVSQANAGCVGYAVKGAEFFRTVNAATVPAAVINPHANPMIEAFAQLLEGFGTQFGPSIAPFGPTVAGMGADARFFKGS